MRGGGEAAVLSARPLSRPPPDPFPLVTRPNRLAHPSGPSLHPLSTPSFGCARYLCILRLQAKELKRSEDTLLKAHAELHAQRRRVRIVVNCETNPLRVPILTASNVGCFRTSRWTWQVDALNLQRSRAERQRDEALAKVDALRRQLDRALTGAPLGQIGNQGGLLEGGRNPKKKGGRKKAARHSDSDSENEE
eukprot:1184824-Prorocentrum_minimum.AAC.5